MASSQMTLYGVIMAGGVGERFWPESRAHFPKQYLKLVGDQSLIQATVDRVSKFIPIDRIFVASGASQKKILKRQLPELKAHQLLLEPSGRNTAPCIALAAQYIYDMDPDAVMAVLPADHIIHDADSFSKIMKLSARKARETNALLTIGIKPRGPETGYGYIQFNGNSQQSEDVRFSKVIRFIEKPPLEEAKIYAADGHYLWNSGMFVWRADAILDAIQENAPEVYRALSYVKGRLKGKGRATAITQMYEKVPKISIDYAVMEKAKNVWVVESQFDWDDVGAWSSIERHFEKDLNGNVSLGDSVLMDSKGCVVVNRNGIVGLVGVKDVIVVSTGDATLVIDKSRAQDVKLLLEKFRGRESLRKYL